MDGEVLALLGRKRGVGETGCWLLIDLSTLQRNSVGPRCVQFAVGTGLEAETVGTRARASVAGTNVVNCLSVCLKIISKFILSITFVQAQHVLAERFAHTGRNDCALNS